jgi:hypothetical protein
MQLFTLCVNLHNHFQCKPDSVICQAFVLREGVFHMSAGGHDSAPTGHHFAMRPGTLLVDSKSDG